MLIGGLVLGLISFGLLVVAILNLEARQRQLIKSVNRIAIAVTLLSATDPQGFLRKLERTEKGEADEKKSNEKMG